MIFGVLILYTQYLESANLAKNEREIHIKGAENMPIHAIVFQTISNSVVEVFTD